MKKSITYNATLNGIRKASYILFPFITFPYVSRVLGTDGLGQYNFANSYVSYFLLAAGLGINSYAVREGARFRDNKGQISDFASEMFIINMISTVVSYVFLFLSIIVFSKIRSYDLLIYIFSVEIIFTTIGMEWLYSVYEEYRYITIRTLLFKVISIVAMFSLVNSFDDVAIYALITVFANAGSNILNFIHARKKWKFHSCGIGSLKKHIKPILTLFSVNVAVMVYVHSDTVILGLLQSDHEVGLYSLSAKVYSIIKGLLSAMLIVSVPKLSMYYGKGDNESFDRLLQRIFDSVTVILLPCVIGLFSLSENITVLVGGEAYRSAASSLKILSVSLLFCLYGYIGVQCILVPTRSDKSLSIFTIVTAIVNIVLNLLLIPFWAENAAAFTTMLAELLMLILCVLRGRKMARIRILDKNFFQALLGSSIIFVICLLCKGLIANNIVCIVSSMILSGVGYSAFLVASKNELFRTTIKKLFKH